MSREEAEKLLRGLTMDDKRQLKDFLTERS